IEKWYKALGIAVRQEPLEERCLFFLKSETICSPGTVGRRELLWYRTCTDKVSGSRSRRDGGRFVGRTYRPSTFGLRSDGTKSDYAGHDRTIGSRHDCCPTAP
ncbi:hypothetical protein IscW_ISCW010642, partial [Ixodes scapularis]